VAHSYGGLIVRSFTRKYPGLVAGLVLVDTAEESWLFVPEVLDFYAKARLFNRGVTLLSRFAALRLLRKWVDLGRFGLWLERPAEYQALCDDLASLERVPAGMRGSEQAGSLGALPLAVITHGQPFPFAVLERNWSQGQASLAALSSNSLLTVATRSNHMIQIDEPDLVVEVIRRIHAAAQQREPIRG
jgi:pimeloyl-ACP methyl ester carboxylesterase